MRHAPNIRAPPDIVLDPLDVFHSSRIPRISGQTEVHLQGDRCRNKELTKLRDWKAQTTEAMRRSSIRKNDEELFLPIIVFPPLSLLPGHSLLFVLFGVVGIIIPCTSSTVGRHFTSEPHPCTLLSHTPSPIGSILNSTLHGT